MTKEDILKKVKKNPEHILCLFTKDNFKIAKLFWGEEDYALFVEGNWQETVKKEDTNDEYKDTDWSYYEPIWKTHLQIMVINKNRIKYLEQSIK